MEPNIARPFCWRWSRESCVSGSQRIEKHEIFQVHTFFGQGTRMVTRNKWKNFDLLQLFFIALVNIVEFFSRSSFFSSLLHVLGWRFLVLHFYRDGCICNRNWFDHEWLDFGFFSEYASICRRHACIYKSIRELLIRFPRLATWNLSDF